MNSFDNAGSHPSWQDRDFEKKEYVKMLKALADKATDSSIMVNNNCLTVVGKMTQIWQTVKGVLGFENNTNPIKVNYELLKLLRYGQRHFYLQENEIKPIVQQLCNTLLKDPQHEKIAKIFQNVLIDASESDQTHPQTEKLDHEISIYHGRFATELHEAFWTRVYHRYIAPSRSDPLFTLYNIACRHCLDNENEKAIKTLEKALNQTENKPEWELTLAHLYAKLAKEQSETGNETLAIQTYDKTIEILNRKNITSVGVLFTQDAAHLKNQVIIAKACALAKSGFFDEAAVTLNNANSLGHKTVSNLIDVEFQARLSSHLSHKNYGKLLLALAKIKPDQEIRNHLLMNAIDLLYAANKNAFSVETSEQLINACLTLVDFALKTNDLDEAKNKIKEAFYHYEFLKSCCPLAASSTKLIEGLVKSLQTLADAQKEQNDFHSAIHTMQKIETLTEKNPLVLAKIHFHAAQIAKLDNHHFQALIEAEKSYRLDQNPETQQLIDELLEHLAANPEFELVLVKLDSFIQVIEQILTRTETSSIRKLLARALMAKTEILIESQNFKEALKIALKSTHHLCRINKEKAVEERGGKDDFAILIKHSLLFQLTLQINLGDTLAAIKTLKSGVEITGMSYQGLLENYIVEFMMRAPPSNEMFGSFYKALAEDPYFLQDIEEYQTRTIDLLSLAFNQRFDTETGAALIDSLLKKGSSSFSAGKLAASEDAYNEALKVLNKLKEGAPTEPCLDTLQMNWTACAMALVENCKELAGSAQCTEINRKNYLQIAVSTVKKMKEMHLNNRKEFASLTYSMAKLEHDRGNLFDALTEARQAVNLDPLSTRYRAFLNQLTGDTNTQKLLADTYFKEEAFDKSLECYLNCFEEELRKNPKIRGETLAKLLHLADQVKLTNINLAARGFEAFANYFVEMSTPLEKQIEINCLIASRYERTLEWTSASTFYQNALNLAPENVELIRKTAFCFIRMGNIAGAEKIWKDAIDRNQNNGALHFGLAKHLRENGNKEGALKVFEEAFELNNEDKTYVNQLISLQVEIGDQILNKTKKINPETVRQSVIQLRDHVLTSTTRDCEAVRYGLRDYFSFMRNSQNQKEFHQLGTSNDTIKSIVFQAERAVELIESTIRGAKIQSTAHLKKMIDRLRVETAALKDDLLLSELPIKPLAERAIPHYLKASELSGDTPGDYINKLIDAYVKAGEFKSAIETYETNCKKFPGFIVRIDLGAYLKLMEFNLKLEDFKQALAVIKCGLKVDPDSNILKRGLSHFYFILGEDIYKKSGPAKALNAYLKAVDCGVDAEVTCYFKLGKMYLEAINKVEFFNVKDLAKLTRYEISAIEREHRQEAIKYLKAAADLDRNNASYQFEIGKILEEAYEPEYDPLPYVRRAVSLDKNQAEYPKLLAKILRTVGQEGSIEETEANELYKKLTAHLPDPDRYEG